MTLFRISIQGFVLAVCNITAILLSFGLSKAVGSEGQLGMQLPTATLISVSLFMGWQWLSYKKGWKKVWLTSPGQFVWTFVAAAVWNPILFTPLHFMTQGYLTSTGNLVAILYFQVPINIFALVLALESSRYQPAT